MVGENIRVPRRSLHSLADLHKRRTANLILIGPADHALKEIPWGVLIFFNQPLAKKKVGPTI